MRTTLPLLLVLLTACASDRRELEQLVGTPLTRDTELTSWQFSPDYKPTEYYGVRKLDEAGFRRLVSAVGLTPKASAGIAEAVWRLPAGVTLKGWAAPSVPAGAGLDARGTVGGAIVWLRWHEGTMFLVAHRAS
jgi:hypothetical protein